MAEESTNLGDDISLSVPKKHADETYFLHVSNALAKFDQIIFTLSGPTDHRIVPYTRSCINKVVDDKVREGLYKALDDVLDYLDSVDLAAEERGSFQIEACEKIIAQIYSWMDDFVGLVKSNAIVPIASEPTEAEIAAVQDILAKGKDIDVGGDEESNPEGADIAYTETPEAKK